MNKLLFVTLGFAVIAVAACKKDSDNREEPVPAVELITSTTWKIDTIGFDLNKNGEIDTEIPGGFEPCDLDNTITFATDSTGIYSEGALKCTESAPSTIPFTWHLKNDDKVIYIEGDLPGDLNGDVNILALSADAFVLSKPVNLTVPFPIDGNLIIALKK